MGEQRAHHVSAGEGDPGLTQVFADRADHHDLAAGEPGGQDQAAQPVVLELSSPDPEERLLENLPYPLHIRRRDLQAEVIDPRRRPIARQDLIRPLIDHLGAHVLEGRQHVRKQDAARAEQLAAPGPLGDSSGRYKLMIGSSLIRAARPGDIGDGGAGEPVRAVAGRKRLLVARVQVRSALFAMLVDQRIAEVVAPSAGRLDQPGLHLGDVEVAGIPSGHRTR